jgi:hypothetical protein
MKVYGNAVLRVLSILIISGMLTSAVLAGGYVRVAPLSNSSKATVTLVDVDARVAHLSIEDKDENVVFYDEMVNDPKRYNRTFDFSKLSNGSYYVIAKTDDALIKKEFKVEASKLDMTVKDTIVDPVVKIKGNTLALYFQSPPAEKLKISFAHSKERFFTETLERKEKFVRGYDISKLAPGNYNFTLKAGDYEYNYSFLVR